MVFIISKKIKVNKMGNLTKGLCCCQCYSVIFDVSNLVQHIAENPSHNYWKFGDGNGVIYMVPMLNRQIHDEITYQEELHEKFISDLKKKKDSDING